LISLSPLIATHPSILQHTRVRSSDRQIINLVTIRSLGFGSKVFNFSLYFELLAFTTSTPIGLNFAKNLKLLAHYTKGTSSGCCPFRLFVTFSDFKSSISLPHRCFFTFPSLVLMHYRLFRIFRLRGWSPSFHTTLHGARTTHSMTYDRFDRALTFFALYSN